MCIFVSLNKNSSHSKTHLKMKKSIILLALNLFLLGFIMAQTNVVATSSTTGVRISWSPGAASEFAVFRNTVNSKTDAKKLISTLRDLGFTDATGEVGKTYYYYVAGYTGWGTIPLPSSNIVSGSRLATLSLSSTRFDAVADGQSFQATASTNAASTLKVSTTFYWLTASLSGTTVRITAAGNLGIGRVGFVTVSAGGKTQDMYIYQAAATTLSVNKTTYDNVSVDGAYYTPTVTTNASSWNLSTTASWIIVQKLSNTSFSIKCQANSGGSRNGTVRIVAGNKIQDVNVNQVGLTVSINPVSPLIIAAAGVSKQAIQVTTNSSNWSVVSFTNWIKVTKLQYSFLITCSPNTSTTLSRPGTLKIYVNNKVVVDFTINQAKKSTTSSLVSNNSNKEQVYAVLPKTTPIVEENNKNDDLIQTTLSINTDKIDYERGQQMFVYPNPANSTLNFNYNLINDGQIDMSLLNISGQIIKQHKRIANKGDNSLIINVEDIQNGFYVLKLQTSDGFKTQKVQIQH